MTNRQSFEIKNGWMIFAVEPCPNDPGVFMLKEIPSPPRTNVRSFWLYRDGHGTWMDMFAPGTAKGEWAAFQARVREVYLSNGGTVQGWEAHIQYSVGDPLRLPVNPVSTGATIPCPDCGGTYQKKGRYMGLGFLPDEVCKTCNGTGEVAAPAQAYNALDAAYDNFYDGHQARWPQIQDDPYDDDDDYI